MKYMSHDDIRNTWFKFFEEKGHKKVESASLVPVNDDSLLWVNAGVTPLKKYFDGSVVPDCKRLVSIQKCIRTNDIENVGVTKRHQTFFEMMGNFSIGDYFKNEAIEYSFELLTSPNYFGIDKELLYVTIYTDDDDAFNRWIEVGMEPSHIVRLEENFWEIGEGPCGPDSEIFFDRGEKYDPEGDALSKFRRDEDQERYVEIWNNVFSQFNSKAGVPRNQYKELPNKNIDTGAGLERWCCIFQGVDSNFETDLFRPIIDHIIELAGATYTGQKEYKVIFNNDYYTPDSNDFDSITKFDKLDTQNQVQLEQAYNNSSVTLKISGIIRIKEDATSQILRSGLVYMSNFEKFYAQDCKNSLIAQKQLANKNSYEFYDNYMLSVAEFSSKEHPMLPEQGFANVTAINTFLNTQYGYTLSDEDAFDVAMQQIGISSIPVSIKFYPKNFDAKDRIVAMIDEYNTTVDTEAEKIIYSDTTGFLTTTLGSLVNIVSYVLIAFAGISLVVSSVMIGIITYTSVIERTKEIGVLRSIGARKKDISRIFNSETILIGLFAGILGVTLSWVLTIPLSAIIKAIAGGTITTNMATLKFTHALILVAVSTVLTTIAGTVPARIASKKDPVICLRSE